MIRNEHEKQDEKEAKTATAADASNTRDSDVCYTL